MYIRESLLPLTRSEVEQYIKFRIAAAGGDVNIVASEVYDVIMEKTKGMYRKINQVMTLALMDAFFTSQHLISFDIINKIT